MTSECSFKINDLVRVAHDPGDHFEKFDGDHEGIVLEVKPGNGQMICRLQVRGHGDGNWTGITRLSLIRHDETELLQQWQDEEEMADRLGADHAWVFSNGAKILTSGARRTTLQMLAKDLGVSRFEAEPNEFVSYYMNAMAIANLARPFLATGDLSGWKAFCASAEIKGESAPRWLRRLRGEIKGFWWGCEVR